jgi:hypothetical protein
MANVSKRLEQIISKELSKNLVPIKTEQGILVGNVLIKSQANLKFLYRKENLLYGEIFLNLSAISIANIMAKNISSIRADDIYRADQEYARYYTDSQLLRANYEKSLKNRDFDKADVFWARYQETRDRARIAKIRVESLAKS